MCARACLRVGRAKSWQVVGWFSSRGGCTSLSPPTGCSSSAPGSERGPLGRRPLSTSPSFFFFFWAVGERHRSDTFFRFQWQICNHRPSLVFPYKARKRWNDHRPEVTNNVYISIFRVMEKKDKHSSLPSKISINVVFFFK